MLEYVTLVFVSSLLSSLYVFILNRNFVSATVVQLSIVIRISRYFKIALAVANGTQFENWFSQMKPKLYINELK